MRQDIYQLMTQQNQFNTQLLEKLRQNISRQFSPYIVRTDLNTIIIDEGNGNCGYVIGQHGNTLQKLREKYPDIQISVPRHNDQNRHIYIHNCNRSKFSLAQACANEIINLLSYNQ